MASPHLVQMDIQQSVEMLNAFEIAPDIFFEEMTATTWQSELLLERDIKELTPVGIGGGSGLKGDISAREPIILADNVIGATGTSLNYAVPVELGTKPHMPPIQPLADWAEQVLGVGSNEAWRVGTAIAYKINRDGTEGAHMFERGFKANQQQIQQLYQDAGERIIARIAGQS